MSINVSELMPLTFTRKLAVAEIVFLAFDDEGQKCDRWCEKLYFTSIAKARDTINRLRATLAQTNILFTVSELVEKKCQITAATITKMEDNA